MSASDLTAQLLARRNADGGWGGVAGVPGRTETTALAVMALEERSDERSAAAVELGRGWLRERQRADGSWPVGDDATSAGVTTALAVLALGEADRTRAVAGAEWLLHLEGRTPPWYVPLLDYVLDREEPVAGDHQLVGWPWVPATYSWVEPTAYALLALKRYAPSLPAGRTRDRISEGEALLLDRECPGGGWNYGNTRVFGHALEPMADVTALALLSLQDRPRLPVVRRGLKRLVELTQPAPSTLSLALSGMCRSVLEETPPLPEARVAAAFNAAPVQGTRELAYAMLAAGSARAFRLPRVDR